MSLNCESCDRSFDSDEALQKHLRDSPKHVSSFYCKTCDRCFVKDRALQQHLRDSPVHAPSFACNGCDLSFDSDEALQQHLRDSPVHAPSFDHEDCDRSIGSEEALEEHLQESPLHAPSFACETCDRSFGSDTALEQHLRDSSAHEQAPQTPLDVFFRSFPTYDYDPSLPPATSYAYLRKHEGWQRGEVASDDAWCRYQDALAGELRMWYGEENNLTAWHALCRAIGIEPLPRTCEQCEEIVRRTHVNIVDLIEWGRKQENTEDRVQTFRTVRELRDYSKETGKIFHNTLDKEEGNVVLRHLLRKIFRGGL